MPVNLPTPDNHSLHPVAGVRLGVARAGIRKKGRKDLLVISLAEGARVAGVFTRNRFCAAPVTVAKEHLAREHVRALVVNTGCANAGTGDEGLARARQVCQKVGQLLGAAGEDVLPFSTGVIMEHLPVERIEAALPGCIEHLSDVAWRDAAEAIMTTDTVPKAVSRTMDVDGKRITITGIAKGSGMIRPNMATMLGFVATDAKISQTTLQRILKFAVHRSFNCVTVDGDMSTNDCLMLIATGGSGASEIANEDSAAYLAIRDGVTELCIELAQMLVRDGEGATKFVTVRVDGGETEDECRAVAYAIAHSPLVKTAFFASDPNLGRILAAVGYAGIDDLDVGGVDLYLDDVLVASRGGRSAGYREEDGKAVMNKQEFTVNVCLNRGAATATVWTCDLSHDYVSINADYRS